MILRSQYVPGEFDGGEWPPSPRTRRLNPVSDATLDRRVYSCQNWRPDVVAILAGLAESPQSAARRGRLIERAWPRAKSRDGQARYGTPHGSTNGDFTGSATGADDHYLVPNGIVDGDDQTVFTTLFNAPDDLADMTGSSDSGDPDYGRPDGTLDASDLFFWLDCNAAADDLGRNVLSEGHTGASLGTFSIRNRKGLAGYEWDPAIRKYHVRNRVLDPETGRWNRRDPLGYVDGMGLYGYVRGMPLAYTDEIGLSTPARRCAERHYARIVGTTKPPASCANFLMSSLLNCCNKLVTTPSDPDFDYGSCLRASEMGYQACMVHAPPPPPPPPPPTAPVAPGTPRKKPPLCYTQNACGFTSDLADCYVCCLAHCNTNDLDACYSACKQNNYVPLGPPRTLPKIPGISGGSTITYE